MVSSPKKKGKAFREGLEAGRKAQALGRKTGHGEMGGEHVTQERAQGYKELAKQHDKFAAREKAGELHTVTDDVRDLLIEYHTHAHTSRA